MREKERFKANPFNYAMKKTQLMKERDSALARGDDELSREINQQIQELEERASELDKMRTSTISSISYINDRNRKRNVEEAEKAIMEEVRANKGKKVGKEKRVRDCLQFFCLFRWMILLHGVQQNLE